jgi:hypothetical protein
LLRLPLLQRVRLEVLLLFVVLYVVASPLVVQQPAYVSELFICILISGEHQHAVDEDSASLRLFALCSRTREHSAVATTLVSWAPVFSVWSAEACLLTADGWCGCVASAISGGSGSLLGGGRAGFWD